MFLEKRIVIFFETNLGRISVSAIYLGFFWQSKQLGSYTSSQLRMITSIQIRSANASLEESITRNYKILCIIVKSDTSW